MKVNEDPEIAHLRTKALKLENLAAKSIIVFERATSMTMAEREKAAQNLRAELAAIRSAL